jgi:hypothetical protein
MLPTTGPVGAGDALAAPAHAVAKAVKAMVARTQRVRRNEGEFSSRFHPRKIFVTAGI